MPAIIALLIINWILNQWRIFNPVKSNNRTAIALGLCQAKLSPNHNSMSIPGTSAPFRVMESSRKRRSWGARNSPVRSLIMEYIPSIYFRGVQRQSVGVASQMWWRITSNRRARKIEVQPGWRKLCRLWRSLTARGWIAILKMLNQQFWGTQKSIRHWASQAKAEVKPEVEVGHCRRVQTEPKAWIEASAITEVQAKVLAEVGAEAKVDHNPTLQVEEEKDIQKYQALFPVILIPSVTNQQITLNWDESHTSKTVSNLFWISRTPEVVGPSKSTPSLPRVDTQTLDHMSPRKTIWNLKCKSSSFFGVATPTRLPINYKEGGKWIFVKGDWRLWPCASWRSMLKSKSTTRRFTIKSIAKPKLTKSPMHF